MEETKRKPALPKSDKIQPRPSKLKEMITIAENLAKPFDLVRVDLYYDELTTEFLVEITHCHGSAMNPLILENPRYVFLK